MTSAQSKKHAMAENEESYLKQCREKELCPNCQKSLANKLGSGSFKEGVFCSLDCYTKWHEAALIRRHKARLKKE